MNEINSVAFSLNTIDGSMISSIDYKPMKNQVVKFERFEYKKPVQLTVNPQLSTEIGNHFFLSFDIHKDSTSLADYGVNRQCSITVRRKNSRVLLFYF